MLHYIRVLGYDNDYLVESPRSDRPKRYQYVVHPNEIDEIYALYEEELNSGDYGDDYKPNAFREWEKYRRMERDIFTTGVWNGVYNLYRDINPGKDKIGFMSAKCGSGYGPNEGRMMLYRPDALDWQKDKYTTYWDVDYWKVLKERYEDYLIHHEDKGYRLLGGGFFRGGNHMYRDIIEEVESHMKYQKVLG